MREFSHEIKPSLSNLALWQGAWGTGGRVQVCQPLLFPLCVRKLDSSWPQEARRAQLSQGLEGSGKGEMMFWQAGKISNLLRWGEASAGLPMRREYLRRKTRWAPILDSRRRPGCHLFCYRMKIFAHFMKRQDWGEMCRVAETVAPWPRGPQPILPADNKLPKTWSRLIIQI